MESKGKCVGSGQLLRVEVPLTVMFIRYLSSQVASVRKVMGELSQWRSDHADILRCLRFMEGPPFDEPHLGEPPLSGAVACKDCAADAPTGTSTASSRSQKGSGGKAAVGSADVAESRERKGPEGGIGAGMAADDSIKSEKAVEKVTLQSLSACIHAAEKMTMGRSMKEVREMRSVLQGVNDWIEQCQSLCPRRQSKRRVQPTNKPTFKRLEDFMAEGLAFPVAVTEEVARIRKHIAEASSWQANAQLVLEKVSGAFAEQTMERMDLWRREEESRCDKPAPATDGSRGTRPKVVDPAKGDGTSKGADPNSPRPQTSSDQTSAVPGSAASTCTGRGEQSDDTREDQGSDALDREDELDEAEESNEEQLRQLLTTARDISVFMPEEMVTERMQKIMEWAR